MNFDSLAQEEWKHGEFSFEHNDDYAWMKARHTSTQTWGVTSHVSFGQYFFFVYFFVNIRLNAMDY